MSVFFNQVSVLAPETFQVIFCVLSEKFHQMREESSVLDVRAIESSAAGREDVDMHRRSTGFMLYGFYSADVRKKRPCYRKRAG